MQCSLIWLYPLNRALNFSLNFQEGLLDLLLTFSDGSVVNLRDINPSDYFLSVKSLEPQVLAFTPTHGAR